MKRRLLSFLLASIMLISCLTGCGGTKNDSNEESEQIQQSQDASQGLEIESEVESETEEISAEEKWYNSAESNGVGFSISQSCVLYHRWNG